MFKSSLNLKIFDITQNVNFLLSMIISILLKFICNDIKDIVIVLFNVKFKNKFKKNFKRLNINRVIKFCRLIKKIKNLNIKNIIL